MNAKLAFPALLVIAGFLIAGAFTVPLRESQRIKGNPGATRPNVVIIMADDMGWSDTGPFGSEIPTPNLDALAKNGVRFSQFYNNARCCPTRASLLTGLNAHRAGIGQMAEDPGPNPKQHDWGTDGYRGFLNRHCVTIAEVLKTAGYHTYMTGKWHVGMHGQEKWPLQRGFERYYGILAGATSYFRPQGGRGLTLDNQPVQSPADPNYYTTDAFTDYAIRFVTEQADENPFFLYLAYNAPHWPLQAKPADIARFKDRYKVGWDIIRQERLTRQEKTGLVGKGQSLSARDKRVRPWQSLSAGEQDSTAYRMAVYAAQISSLDENVGKLVASLKERGQFNNTLILFLSDNGACAETYNELGSSPMSLINNPDFSGAASYGIGWANASNTPFFEYKVKSYEGGIRAPLIAHFPTLIRTTRGRILTTRGHVTDLMPTILELAGATYPGTFHEGQSIFPLEGRSLVPALQTGKQADPDYMYWEHEWYGAVRKGNWKAVHDLRKGTWELYNLGTDRIESRNEAQNQSALLADLQQHWQQWANTHAVLPKRLN